MSAQVKRMDPSDCGCTDCLTGYSVPINYATAAHFDAVVSGDMTDATGLDDYDWDQYSDKKIA